MTNQHNKTNRRLAACQNRAGEHHGVMTITPEIEAALERYVTAVAKWHSAPDDPDIYTASSEELQTLEAMIEARRALHVALGLGDIVDVAETGSWA